MIYLNSFHFDVRSWVFFPSCSAPFRSSRESFRSTLSSQCVSPFLPSSSPLPHPLMQRTTWLYICGRGLVPPEPITGRARNSCHALVQSRGGSVTRALGFPAGGSCSVRFIPVCSCSRCAALLPVTGRACAPRRAHAHTHARAGRRLHTYTQWE